MNDRYDLTYDQFLIECDGPVPDGMRRDREDNAPQQNEWAGGTFESAHAMARTGWPEGLARMQRATAGIAAPGQPRPDEYVYDVAGCEPSIERYLSGEPECMATFAESPEHAIVRIVANVSASAFISADVLFTRGAALTQLIEAIELAGNRCELFAGYRTRINDSRYFEARVLIKRSNEPLDLDRIAFVFANPSFLRRLIFSLQESKLGRDNPSSMGTPAPIEPSPDIDILTPEARSDNKVWNTPESARAWMNATLAKYVSLPV